MCKLCNTKYRKTNTIRLFEDREPVYRHDSDPCGGWIYMYCPCCGNIIVASAEEYYDCGCHGYTEYVLLDKSFEKPSLDTVINAYKQDMISFQLDNYLKEYEDVGSESITYSRNFFRKFKISSDYVYDQYEKLEGIDEASKEWDRVKPDSEDLPF